MKNSFLCLIVLMAVSGCVRTYGYPAPPVAVPADAEFKTGSGEAQEAPIPLTDQERAELQTILYVVHANSLCSWPMSAVIKSEIDKYLDYYKQRLQYDEYNKEDAQAAASIEKRKKKICSSAKERKKYEDALNHIVPFATAHPEAAAQADAMQAYYQGVQPSTPGAVEVPYVYYSGFWWGAIWFPAGYYDPFWRYYGWGPGPRFVIGPGYSWYPYHHGYYGYPGAPLYHGGPGFYGPRYGGSYRGAPRYR